MECIGAYDKGRQLKTEAGKAVGRTSGAGVENMSFQPWVSNLYMRSA